MAGRPGRGRRETYGERLARRASIDDPEIVLNAAARYLEVRSRSVDELRRHLKGYPPAHVEAAIGRLLALGMLDDEAFARAWIESRDRAHPRGEQALRRELTQKGIDRALVAELLTERSQDDGAAQQDGGGGSPDLRAAERLLGRRASTLLRIADPRQRRQRAYALLARSGFDPDVCRQAVGRFAESHGAPEDEE